MTQGGLKSWIELSLEPHWLCANDCLMGKCLQLHGTMKVHQGVMIVGASGRSTTKCYSSLAETLNLQSKSHHDGYIHNKACKLITVTMVNPNAIFSSHLFGSLNNKTQS
jgi:hypothetical protein